ncbi:MAG TPA: cytochrome P450 [Solirubrobacteraceae bacterium]
MSRPQTHCAESKLLRRARRDLPPGGLHPSSLQTLAARFAPYAYFEQCHRRLGDRFTLYPIDHPPLVMLANPDDIAAVTASDPCELHPGEGAKMIGPIVGSSSFMLLEEAEHMRARRSITPAFHRRVITEQGALLHETVEHEVATLPENVAVALDPWTRALTAKVILRTIFGEEDDLVRSLHGSVLSMLTITATAALQAPKLRLLPGWRHSWSVFLARRAEVEAVIDLLIARRRKQEPLHGRDLLDLLVEREADGDAGGSDGKLRDDLISMITAGHETTTGQLGWALQLLAHNPHAQDRLIDEIDTGAEDNYLTAVIHETLRVRPVFLFAIPRAVVSPVEIGGYLYRPPAHLAACTYLMHRNPDLYRDPDRFLPERFLGGAPYPPTWLPWGGGRKHCLGRHFAMLELRTLLREILARNRVLPVARTIEAPRWRSAIVVPRDGCRIRLCPRHDGRRA